MTPAGKKITFCRAKYAYIITYDYFANKGTIKFPGDFTMVIHAENNHGSHPMGKLPGHAIKTLYQSMINQADFPER